MKAFDHAWIAIELVFYFFHLSLLIVLVVNCKTKFYGSFNNMLRILFASDILFFVTSFASRFAMYGLWHDFYKNNAYIATINIHLSSYFMVLQFIIHGFIPFNRFTLLWFPLGYKKLWSRQWYTVLLLVIPLLLISPRITEKGIYLFSDDGNVLITFENPETTKLALILSMIYWILITVISALLNSLAILKFYFYRKNTVTSAATLSVNDIAFLYLSCVMFVVHLLACLIIIGRTFLVTTEHLLYVCQISWIVVTDVLAWCGSFSMLILCKHTRKAYIQFYSNLWNAKPTILKISATLYTQK